MAQTKENEKTARICLDYVIRTRKYMENRLALLKDDLKKEQSYAIPSPLRIKEIKYRINELEQFTSYIARVTHFD